MCWDTCWVGGQGAGFRPHSTLQLASLCGTQPAQPCMATLQVSFHLTRLWVVVFSTSHHPPQTSYAKKERKPSVRSKPFSVFNTHDIANEIMHHLLPKKESRNWRYYSIPIVFLLWDLFGRKERTTARWYWDLISAALTQSSNRAQQAGSERDTLDMVLDMCLREH